MKSSGMTILVVDDEPVNVLLLKALLKNQGYKVLTAENGVQARQIAVREVPDLILLDVMMPVEDGFIACEKLQKNPVTMDIPIVFISAMVDVKSKVKGLKAGAWDYVTKPFQKEEIFARVKNYLKLRHTFLRVIEEQSKRLKQISDAQQAILVKPADLPGIDFGVNYLPVLEAGGDFYDAFEIRSGTYGFFVADISGHDLGASFATSALKALIRQNSSPLYRPDETIRMINSILITLFQGGQHLTAAYLCIDQHNSKVMMVNAAHLPVLILPLHADPIWFSAEGDVIGVFDSAVYECKTLEIEGGERIFLYTDGLLEIFAENSRTREEGMAELLQHAKESREMAIQEAVEQIIKNMFVAGRKPDDDIILLGVDVKLKGSDKSDVKATFS